MLLRFLQSGCTTLFLAATLGPGISYAATLYDSGTQYVSATDRSQVGRLSRDGIPSDWSANKPFPGEIGLDTTFNYRTFSLPIGNLPFIQVSFDYFNNDTQDLFASAYLNSYDPADKSSDYLGDAGSSATYPADPIVFQLHVNPGNNLILVVNTAAPDAFSTPFRLLVEGFGNTQFSNTPIPEPATLSLLLSAGAIFVLIRRQRRAV